MYSCIECIQVCTCVCASLSKYSISSSSSYLARAYSTVLIYLPLNLFIFHDHSDSNLQSRHFVHETSDFHFEFDLSRDPPATFPLLLVPLSVYTQFYYISFFQSLQTIFILTFSTTQRMLPPHFSLSGILDYIPRARRNYSRVGFNNR